MISSGAFYPYKLHWKETLVTATLAATFVASSLLFLHFAEIGTVSYSHVAFEAATFVLFAISFSYLRKKIRSTVEAPLPEQKNETKTKKEIEIPASSPPAPAKVEMPKILIETPSVQKTEETTTAPQPIEVIKKEMGALFTNLHDLLAVFLTNYQLNSELKSLRENVAAIEKILNSVIESPPLFFKTALNLLPPCLNKEGLKMAMDQKTDVEFLYSFVSSFEIVGDGINESYAHFQKFFKQVYAKINQDQLIAEEARKLKNEPLIDETTTKLIIDFRLAYSKNSDLFAPTYALLIHLFERTHVNEEIVKAWMIDLSIPVLKLIKLDPSLISSYILRIKQEFSDTGMCNETYLKKKISESVGNNWILSAAIKAGITTTPVIMYIKVSYVAAYIKMMQDKLILPIENKAFYSSLENVANLLVEPGICGLFMDKDPIHQKLKKIANSLECVQVKTTATSESEQAFQIANGYLKYIAQKLKTN